jgi:hypothetical protein
MTDAQGHPNTLCQIPDVSPSNDLRLRPRSAPNFSTSVQASAPVRRNTPGQDTYVVSTLPNQRIGGTTRVTRSNSPVRPLPASLIESNGPLVQGLVDGYSPIPPLAGPIPDYSAQSCVCTSTHWSAWCPRVWEHVKLYSSLGPCFCGWAQSMPQLPRCCPKAASHFLDWVSSD